MDNQLYENSISDDKIQITFPPPSPLLTFVGNQLSPDDKLRPSLPSLCATASSLSPLRKTEMILVTKDERNPLFIK